MILSDISVKRPILATVLSLVIVVLGIIGYTRLGVREFPDIDPPVVTVDTTYIGAAANVVETRVTQVLEDAISGVEGHQDGQLVELGRPGAHHDRVRARARCR
jgi:multidrug efflux pump